LDIVADILKVLENKPKTHVVSLVEQKQYTKTPRAPVLIY
jgi:hypothetical protein